jgi:hypothetical protein
LVRGLTSTTTSTASGTTKTTLLTKGGSHQVTTRASVVPSAPYNILSASNLTDQGYSVVLSPPGPPDNSRLISPAGTTVPLSRKGGLWQVPSAATTPSPSGETALLTQSEAHVRFGHRNNKSLRHTAKHDNVKGLSITGPTPDVPCLPCSSGKLKRSPATKGPHAPRATAPFQAFSVDATGERDISRYGNKYAHSFRDLFSNRQATICTPSLSGEDTQDAIRRWLALWLPVGMPTRGITYKAEESEDVC